MSWFDVHLARLNTDLYLLSTATFQLLAQIIKLSYFPQIEVIHTSKIFHNQLYVPLANYLMLIGTVVVTAVFRNTTSLGQAYGVCVMFVSEYNFRNDLGG